MNIEELLANPPKFHYERGEMTTSWKLADEELLLLDKLLTPDMKTIETGAGISTIVFAIKGTEHTCITPASEEIQRIQSYCHAQSISCDRIKFITEPSQIVLPSLPDKEFNLALIDGFHAFPTPFIDWFYIRELLAIGGILIVDDLHIWTCEILTEFLMSDDSWEIIQENLSAATFKKINNNSQTKEWGNQPFVLSRSRYKTLSGKARYLLNLLKRKNYSLFWQVLLLGISSIFAGNFGQRDRR